MGSSPEKVPSLLPDLPDAKADAQPEVDLARVEETGPKKAEAKKAKAVNALATAGANYDAETALAEATAAQTKLEATAEGVKAGRAWVASIVQMDALGTAESKDLADAYLAWFGMRAKFFQAAFQWNVAVVRLGRATGEYRVSGYRPLR